MNEKPTGTLPPGMNLQDILYIVFRHKWKILTISLLGVGLAVLLPRVRPVPFESEARLYIRYVLETRAPTQSSDGDTRIRAPELRGDSIINTELEILTSRDLAKQVATAIGPARLLGPGEGTNLEMAAVVVQKGVKVEVPRDSSVVRLAFQHADPEIVRPVLNQLIEFYFKKHAEMHGGGAFDEFLAQETDQLRSRLAQTEEELRKAKAKAGVISVEDAKKAYGEESTRIQQQLLDSEAELASRRAAVKELTKAAQGTETVSTNEAPPANYSAVPTEKLDEYRQVCTLLQSLKAKEKDLLLTYTPSNYLVQVVHRQIEENQRAKRQLETENPGLLVVRVADTRGPSSEQASGSRDELVTEAARVSALEAKIKALTRQLDDVRKQAAAVADAEATITELQRLRDLEESRYRKFSETLAQSQMDEKLGAGKVANISIIQEPTAPQKAKSKLFKIMAGLLFGSIGCAFGLAFLIELYLDQSIRRPEEVEKKLHLPLFINVPLIARNGDTDRLNGKPSRLLEEKSQSAEANPNGGLGVNLAQPNQLLRKYYQALRDRLITYFEMKGLTHKPKLVAITSCAQGSGVSTAAAELAASLSETGEGSVLLVNMNAEESAAHRFYQGKLASGLEAALETGKRDTALVQENLYVVNEGASGERLAPVLPKRFKELVPRLKASDFDYVIFDMPPVSQISLTPRLARFMDVVLMVIEAGKTDRNVIEKASALLSESNENIGVVLNKGRTVVPGWLKQDI